MKKTSINKNWLAVGAIVGPVLFTLGWIILGFVNTGYTLWGIRIPHYSAIEQQISALGVGNTGPYMNTVFIASGILLILGAIGIFRALKPVMPPRAYGWCLALWILPGVGCIMDGIFTFESFLGHFVGFCLVLLSSFAFGFTGIALRRVQQKVTIARWLMLAGVLTIGLTVWFFATFTPTAEGQLTGIAGLTERILVTEILLWYVVMGWLALSDANSNNKRVSSVR